MTPEQLRVAILGGVGLFEAVDVWLPGHDKVNALLDVLKNVAASPAALDYLAVLLAAKG